MGVHRTCGCVDEIDLTATHLLFGTLLLLLLTRSCSCQALKNKPPTPPSSSAAEKPEPFLVGVKKAFRSTQFCMLVVAFGCGVGVFTALTTLMAQIISPHGYDDNDAGTLSGILVGVGLLGGGVSGVLVDHTHARERAGT